MATTSRYVTTNLKMKREALEAFWKRAGIAPAQVTPLAAETGSCSRFLDSLVIPSFDLEGNPPLLLVMPQQRVPDAR